MADVLFYHLTQSKLEQALPGLLERTLQRGWKAVVQFSSSTRREAMDDHLWTFRDDSFLPHASQGDGSGQPVWLTVEDDTPNAANVCFLVDGADRDDLGAFERAIYMFDGYDETAVAQARTQWKARKDEGHALTYWQQDDEGRWVKKA